jgi:hypothetical protein
MAAADHRRVGNACPVIRQADVRSGARAWASSKREVRPPAYRISTWIVGVRARLSEDPASWRMAGSQR